MSAIDHQQQLESLPTGQPIVMGILNTTPDSFSDGGSWGTVDRAVAHAERMLEHGAHVIDVGGESSRPGAHPVERVEELNRVLPVIERLAGRCVLSIDTAKAEVAEAALEAGASIVNDITASLEDVAGSHGAGWIAMHMQGQPRTMQESPTYDDVVAEISEAMTDYVERGKRAGVTSVWVDPGYGFGKTTDHNLSLLRRVEAFSQIAPVVIGVSRKRFIGEVHALSVVGSSDIVAADDRIEGSVLAAVWSWANSANMVRTHDVRVTAVAAEFLGRWNGKGHGKPEAERQMGSRN